MPTEDILDSKILIVDDDMGSRESMKILLSNVYQVLTAEDGRNCLALAKEDKFNLIILDLNLPVMKGLDVLYKVKEIDYSIPVIIVTGVKEHQTIIDALRLGASDFILKPFETAYMRQTVKETLLRAELEKNETEREKIKSSLLPMEEISKNEYYNILNGLHSILESKEPLAKGHSIRVTKYTTAIARELGYSDNEIKTIERTSLLHDIGKIGISDKIITKFGKFTPDEYQEIKLHPEIGTRLLDC